MKNKTSKIVLLFLFVVLTIFTISMIVTFNKVGSCPDVLITSVFAAVLGELGFLSWIRNTKTRYGNDEPKYDNNGDIVG